ncbi:MAG: VTT domain-containing protein [bacterium]|nr:VTT domain-containing protein [bacterium]
MEKKTIPKDNSLKWMNKGKVFLVIIWGIIILIFLIKRKDITIDGILNYTPQSPILAAFMMIGLFALKSLSIVIYSGILYVIDGILFPLPVAILMNICGSIVMVTLPYVIGKKVGARAAVYVVEKYPKAKSLNKLRSENDFIFTFFVRIIGRLPSDIVSMYMGAVGVKYQKYLSGSILGMLPHMITFPVMGMNITNPRSREFIVSLCVEIIIMIGTTTAYALNKRNRKRKYS